MQTSTRSVLMSRSRHAGVTLSTDLLTLPMIFLDIGFYVWLTFAEHPPIFFFFFIVINKTTLSIAMGIIKWWSCTPFMTLCWCRVRYISHLFLPELDGSKLWRSPYQFLSWQVKLSDATMLRTSETTVAVVTDYIIKWWVFLSCLGPPSALVLSDKTCQPVSRGMPFLAGIQEMAFSGD